MFVHPHEHVYSTKRKKGAVMERNDGCHNVGRLKDQDSVNGRREALKKIAVGGGVAAGAAALPS